MNEVDKLEKFLNSKEAKWFFGNWEYGVSTQQFLSGCFVRTTAKIGYNIYLGHWIDNYHMLHVTIDNNNIEFKCKKAKDIILILKSVIIV